MDTTVVPVRDVPVSVLATLKARAEARGVSLSSSLRDLMANEAAMPPIDDVMAAIASREPVSYSAEDLRSFIADRPPPTAATARAFVPELKPWRRGCRLHPGTRLNSLPKSPQVCRTVVRR